MAMAKGTPKGLVKPKGGTPCLVCNSERRHLIEIGLTHGVSHRVLGQRFGISHHAIGRHARAHLSPQVKAAILSAQKPSAVDLEALKISESEGLLSQLVHQRSRLATTIEMAAEMGDTRSMISAESAVTANLALVAKLLGQLVNVHDVRHTNLLVSPDYLALRTALVAALKPFPQAALAVGRALHLLESEAAKEITARAAAAKPARPAPVLIEHEPAEPAPAQFTIPPPPPCPA